MKTLILILAVILSTVLIFGCTGDDTELLKQECVQACNNALSAGQNLTNGPCLLNPMSNSDWVCDVAHSPRIEIDHDIQNQCSEFREGSANHFVEVNSTCNIINVY